MKKAIVAVSLGALLAGAGQHPKDCHADADCDSRSPMLQRHEEVHMSAPRVDPPLGYGRSAEYIAVTARAMHATDACDVDYKTFR